jgi:creatinine amidohydrolase/Fe(II)-dependent formamide hydrolase-like protein
MSLRPDTLVKILVEVCLGLEHQGFKKILITNSHGGNSLWLNVAAREIFDKLTSAKIFLWGTVWSKNKENNWEDYLKSGRTGSGHAGETETSIMMALDTPVRLDVMPREPTKWKNPFTDFWSHDPDGPKISGLATIGTYNVEDICDSYMGDPTHSLKETGEKILENWSNNLLEFIKQYHEYN